MDTVIVAATRSAIGSFGGSLAPLSAVEIGTQVLQGLLQKAGIDGADIDEVILGQVLTAGCGQNPARQTAIHAGLQFTTSAITINKVCGSGLKAVHMAHQAIQCGDAELVVAGGQESMSQAAHVLPNSRSGQRLGNWNMVDTMVHDGLWDAFHNYHMGITAENIANQFGIDRQTQDAFATHSQSKAEAAIAAEKFAEEITPIEVQQRKKTTTFAQDEQPRSGVTQESLSQLRPAFRKDGTVTAGNASTLNDGAAMVLLASRAKAEQLGLPILATIKGGASAGVDPSIMGTGPIQASQKALQKAGWKIDDLELIEANEAFAVQAISVNQGLELDTEIVNVNGGAIALGHPIGASGCRILVTLLHEMQRRNVHKGLATLCIGGGMGMALCVER
ncbi:MAG: acetyl-CoA C-acyltransferase [Oceanospirillaceae bacterium]|nr:acetyl-CoA C-acyltransferase [Oceanospirillaceae bacterium]HCI01955.1 acetyl-CoA C-acetyltransferase [Oceanospirillaceae bacterium]